MHHNPHEDDNKKLNKNKGSDAQAQKGVKLKSESKLKSGNRIKVIHEDAAADTQKLRQGRQAKANAKKLTYGIGGALLISVMALATGYYLKEQKVINEYWSKHKNAKTLEEIELPSDIESLVEEDMESTEATEEIEKETGWVKKDDNWYYYDDEHEMLTDQWIDDTYYVGDDGAMLRDTTTPDGHKVDKNGEIVSMTGQAYGAYYAELQKIESSAGQTGIVSSDVTGVEADKYHDMTGLGLVKLIDFNRDGLDEMLVAYLDNTDKKYHFRVYGYKDDALTMYIDEIMGGNGSPMVYAVGVETSDAGDEYVVTHDGITKHRIYGFDGDGKFRKLKEVGLREIDGALANDSEVARVTASWITYDEKSFPMTMLTDYYSRIREIFETKKTLRLGANAADRNGYTADKAPKEQPEKAKEFTAQQLTEKIYEFTNNGIVDYIYDDFNGDGAKDMVALTLQYSYFTSKAGETQAPDETHDGANFEDGYDYLAEWWYSDGDETYMFYSFNAPVMTGLRLYAVPTDNGKQMAATMYWRDTIMPDYTPGAIINNGKTPYAIDAYGTTGRTTCTESTGIIFKFTKDGGATQLFEDKGYNFSLPTKDRIQYEHATYSIAADGTTSEDCSYGSLIYDKANNKWIIF